MSDWYCDAEDPITSMSLLPQCPNQGQDPVTWEPIKDPMVFFCDEGRYTPKSRRKHMKCYDKSTIRNMYRQRHSVPFVEATSRGKFTDSAMSSIQRQVGEPTLPSVLPSPYPVREPTAPTTQDFFNAIVTGLQTPVRRYLEEGYAVDVRDYRGNTALIKAAVKGQPRSVMLLAMHGANLNAKNYDGLTALMAAAGAGHYNIVDFLLESGANPRLRTRDGRTALDFAVSDRIRNLLLEELELPVVVRRRKPKRKTKRKSKRKSKKKSKRKTSKRKRSR